MTHPCRLVTKVSWGDCDPAGILYTPKVFEYCTRLLEDWFREVAGIAWAGLGAAGLGAPMVHVECDFLSPMPVDSVLVVTLALGRIGTSSLAFAFEGRGEDGTIRFRAAYVSCFADRATGKAAPIPDDIRARASAWMHSMGQC